MKKPLIVLFALLSACHTATTPPPIIIQRELIPRSIILEKPKYLECVDTLGAAKFPAALRAIPNPVAVSCFAKTFGDCFPVMKKELDAGRQAIRVNLIWSDTHQYGDKDLPFIKKESKRWNILCTNFPDRKIEIAPFTEHNVKNPDKFLSVVKANAPNCSYPVNSYWQGSATKNPAYKNEVHGNHSKPPPPSLYNWSDDGRNSVDTNFTETKRVWSGASMLCAWHPSLNGKCSMKDTTPRPERNCFASKEMLKSLVYLFTDKGETSLPKNWIVKSHAERHAPGIQDAKGDKLLIIAPVKVLDKKGKPKPIILKRDGKKVCQLNYYGTYDGIPGTHRYYAPVMGYQCGANLDVYLGKKLYGKINGGFRDGTYREE